MNNQALGTAILVAQIPLIAALPVTGLAQGIPVAPEATGETAVFEPAAASDMARCVTENAGLGVLDGLEVSVRAPPGLVANALTLDIDAAGRAYVVASSRAGLLLDIRQHPDWVPEAHRLRSTEDLRQFFRRVMAPALSTENEWLPDFNEDGSHDYRDLTVVADHVFRVEDTDGDGIADRSIVVHEGFNEDIASDIAGGVLIDGDDLYVTAAPDLRRLRDPDGDGLFEAKTSLSHGYSIHRAFSGHDMSALDLAVRQIRRPGEQWLQRLGGTRAVPAALRGSGHLYHAAGRALSRRPLGVCLQPGHGTLP